jgi:oligopeptide/dipeptide ABC transporter ATP-binding protein
MSRAVTQPSIVEITDLRIDYVARAIAVHAVQGASLHVQDGETVGIVGESGSGKSTIARALMGLLNPRLARITGGAIRLAGQDVTGYSVRQWERMRGSPVAMVFQDPLTYLNPVMTVSAQIGESIRLHDREASRDARLAELLELVKLPHHVAQAYPDELSGGMRQRVLLAIALGCRPRLLIADEPTTALDVTTQAEIMQLLRDLQRQTGMALLLISHDLDLVADTCERLYVMYAGRTVEWGAAAGIFRTPLHPYTRGLLASAEGRRQADGTFVTIPGDAPDLRFDPPGCPFQPRCAESLGDCTVVMPRAVAGGADNHQVRCLAVEKARASGMDANA